MLQKLFMAILSLVTMVASAVMPSGWIVADEAPVVEPPRVVAERVTSLGFEEGKEYARLSVLWVEVDGDRLTEDQWGEGQLDLVSFKVGVKRAEGNSLRLGDRVLPLAPTTVVTIRDFSGRFAFHDVGTASASIALDGEVKNTILKDGSGAGFGTEGRRAKSTGAGERGVERLAYVVLDTGSSVGTLEIAPGEVRKLITDSPAGTDLGGGRSASSIDVRWARLDGEVVTRYSYGDGQLGRVEFEPDARFHGKLNFGGREITLQEGDRVVVREFLGTWSATMRPGGGARLKLDGWAGNAEALQGGTVSNAPPNLAFSFAPPTPTTKDIVTFTADAQDPDGSIVLYDWTFLRKIPDLLEHTPEDLLSVTATGPVVEHRFTRPGTWEVTLRTIDNDGGVGSLTQDVIVGNTPPTAAFDWYPNHPVTDEIVRFYDRSTDLDGEVRARFWTFGDGTTSTEREPRKQYARNGLYNATLTVTDANGDQSTARHLVAVKNAPPQCSFEIDPPDPPAFQVTSLLDKSTDKEDGLSEWKWTVANLDNTSAPAAEYATKDAQHTFLAADLHRISLAVSDVDGDTTTCSVDLRVRNTPPVAGFTWFPTTTRTGELTYLNSTSYDADGKLVDWTWRIQGDNRVWQGPRIAYPFPSASTFDVTLTVTDNGGLQNSITQQIKVDNSAPIASFSWKPVSPYTGQDVTFTNTSYDVDGDAQVSWEWDFGVGETPRTASGPQVTHAFSANGPRPVSLTVTDSKGNARTVVQEILVLNRLPSANVTIRPNPPTIADNVTFTAEGRDPDGVVRKFEWLFGDGGRAEGPVVTHQFLEAGRYEVKLILTDDDDGQNTIPLSVVVRRAGPLAGFVVDPDPSAVGRPTIFRDLSVSRGAPITSWLWDFGNGAKSTQASPTHTYGLAKTYTVSLRVKDQDGNEDATTRVVTVTNPPVAQFTASTLTPVNGETVTFTDTSYDPDGAIADRLWTIDGVDVSTSATHAQAFTGRGLHPVRLKVVDDMGVASYRYENITVRNIRPVANFAVSPTNVVEGVITTLTSTSTDADGTIVPERTQWRIFDSTIKPIGDPTSLTYVFNAGITPVTLTVEDDAGERSSVTKTLAVTAAREARYEIKLRYADGTIPSLTGFSVSATNLRTGALMTVSNGGVETNAANATAVIILPYGGWVPGDVLRISGASLTGSFSYFYTTQARDTYVAQRLIVYPRSFSQPTLVVDPGAVPGSLSGLPRLLNLGPLAGAYYASTGEQVRGHLLANWASPSGPVEGGKVDLWLNRSLTNGVRLPAVPADAPLPLLSARTNGVTVDGRLDFEMPYVLDTGVTRLNPPGWYSLDAVVTWPGALAPIAPARATTYVYVDVEGLFQAVVDRALP